MLYVGCSACGSTGPLWCAGQFMPHAPLPTEASAMGPFCNYCGVLPSLFTCMACGTSQWIYIQGMAPPPQAMGQQSRIAPAVSSNSGSPPHHGAFTEVLVAFAKAAGTGFGDQMGQQAANANPWGSY
jgi:hypothetical protein